MQLPTGTLTFLFSDIVASTRLWEDEPDAMRDALAHHDTALREAIESADGGVVKRTGDGFHAVFEDASSGVAAAVAMQSICNTTNWPTSEPLHVRIGLHTGESQLRDDDYYGPTVNRAARLMAAAHGGQMVCSASTGDLARESLGEGVRLIDLGEHRLRDLARAERVLQIEHDTLPRDFPPLRSIDTLPGNLPTQPNRFLGRHDLVTSLAAQLREARVVTISGIGGAGKTRLALQVAAVLQPEFRDGAWFVDLSKLTDPELVAAEVLDILDYVLAAGEDPVDGLCKRLRRRQRLLILDNCEQVVEGVARLAQAIATTTDVRILATSREGLGIAAEQLLPIPPLDTASDGEAVHLFASRAKAARPNFVLDDSNRDTVCALCRHLDGIPLAIELAAARSRALSPAQILERIDQRFRLLKSGDHTAAARHQTLQAAVDWSYELLTPLQQTALNRLSIFVGGFTLDAAEAVVSDASVDAFEVLDNLDALLDKSLIVADDTALGRRYRLLETIRQYAGERLDQSDETTALRTRHADFYRALAEATAPGVFAASEIHGFDRLDADLDNLQTMLDWHIEQGAFAQVTTLLVVLEPYARGRDHHVWAVPLLDHCIAGQPDDVNLTDALALRARYKSHTVHFGIAADVAAAREAAARAGVPVPLMALLAEYHEPLLLQADALRSYELAEAVAEAAQLRQEPYWRYEALADALMIRCLAKPADPSLIERVAQLRSELTPVWGNLFIKDKYLLCAGLAHMHGDPRTALHFFEEKLQTALRLGSRYACGDAYFFIGLMHFRLNTLPAAAHNFHRALVEFHEIAQRRGILTTLSAVTGIALRTECHKDAHTVLTGLHRARSDLQVPGSHIEQAAETRMGELLQRQLGTSVLTDTEAPDLEAAIDFSLALLVRIERNTA